MRAALKWIGRALGSLVVLALLGLLGVYLVSEQRLNKVYDLKMAHIVIAGDQSTIERGKHLAVAVSMCSECHGDNFGGKVMMDAPVGRVVAPNLTGGKGSAVRNYTDKDWARAIRHGVDRHGRALKIMPAKDYHALSDEELNAIVCYIKSLPPVNSALPSTSLTPLGRLLYVVGELPLLPAEGMDHTAGRTNAPTPGPTMEYGRHMANTGGCVGCHGDGLSGGAIHGAPPDWPHATNLTPDPATGIGGWSEADFFRALREGKRPNGDSISTVMPWRYTAQLTDDDIRALWLYLRSVPPKAEGTH